MADTRSLEHLIGFFMSLKINLFYFNYKIGVFVFRYTQINFPTGSVIILTVPAVPQVRNCGFDTADEVVVTGNISLSCRPVQLNWLDFWSVGWRPEDLTASILDYLLHIADKYFVLVALPPNDGGNLYFFS